LFALWGGHGGNDAYFIISAWQCLRMTLEVCFRFVCAVRGSGLWATNRRMWMQGMYLFMVTPAPLLWSWHGRNAVHGDNGASFLILAWQECRSWWQWRLCYDLGMAEMPFMVTMAPLLWSWHGSAWKWLWRHIFISFALDWDLAADCWQGIIERRGSYETQEKSCNREHDKDLPEPYTYTLYDRMFDVLPPYVRWFACRIYCIYTVCVWF
jgi:hypothetical protein